MSFAMSFRPLILTCLILLFSASQARAALDLPVEDGDVFSARALSEKDRTALRQLLGKQLSSRIKERAAMPDELFKIPHKDSKSPFGTIISDDWRQAMHLYQQNRFDEAAALLAKIQPALPNARARFEAGLLWCRALLAEGKATEAEALIITLEQEERDGWGWNMLSLAMRGELRVWMGDWPAARADLETVASALGDWQIPVSYFLPPGNLPDGVAVSQAQIQAATALAALHIMTGNPESGIFWARYADARLNEVFYLANHGLYGKYFRLPQDAAWGRALNNLFLAAAFEMTGNPQPGFYDRAEQAFAKWNYRPGKVITGSFRAWAALQSGKTEQAITLAEETAALAADLGQPDLVWQVQGHAGKAWLTLGKPDQAEQAFLKAQAAIDLVSGSLSSDRVKIRFGSGKEEITRHLAWLALDRGDYAAAFTRLEQGRARAFMDMLAHHPVNADAAPDQVAAIRKLDRNIRKARFRLLTASDKAEAATLIDLSTSAPVINRRSALEKELAEARANLKRWNYASLDESMKQRLQPLVSRIRHLENKLAKMPKPKPKPKKKAPKDKTGLKKPVSEQAGIRADIRKLLEERTQQVARLASKAPDLAAVFAMQHRDLTALRKQLKPQDSLLYVLPADQQGMQHYLLIRPDSVDIRRSTIGLDDWQALLKDFSQAVAARDDAHQTRLLDNMRAALPAGLGDSNDRLYVVPSGPLFFLPWGALAWDRPIITLPNASWLLRNRVARPAKKAVIVGDPAFGGKLAQLPGARAEAGAVAAMLGQPLIEGSNAQEDALRRALGDGSDVLHLATHGLFRARRPLRSSIVLSDGNAARHLTAAAIFERPLPARLVILSACETGLGQSIAGDDFLGLSRSLFLGGTETILSSLWPIDDAGTKDFMTAFHQYRLKGASTSNAWRQARNDLRDGGYAPAIYGAFILSGSAN